MVTRPLPGAYEYGGVFVDGEWRAGADGEIDVRDCTTGDVIGRVGSAGSADLSAAVAAAASKLGEWSALPPSDRARHLRAWRSALEARSEELTAIVSSEVGTAVRICGAIQVSSALRILGELADAVSALPFEGEMGRTLVVKEAVGVVGALTPWNFPLFQSVGKVAAALAAGCTVVHKPSEVAPLTACVLADAANAAGLPPGVYNMIAGQGPSIGRGVASHPGIAMVSFTGSAPVGTSVYREAAGSIKRVVLELGGKSASVLLEDGPLEQAVRTTVNRAFLNSGQTCDAWTRFLAPRGLEAQVTEALVASSDRLVVGDPFEEATRLGPLISARQAERVRGLIDQAMRGGAKVLVGGSAPLAGLRGDSFVMPTILTQVSPLAAVAQEEIFGPVLVVLTYDDEDEAIRLANDSEYGLSGAVWSSDRDRAVDFARRMQTGQVVINGAGFDPCAPFGGVKRSGLGRELGRYGIEAFLETKALVI